MTYWGSLPTLRVGRSATPSKSWKKCNTNQPRTFSDATGLATFLKSKTPRTVVPESPNISSSLCRGSLTPSLSYEKFSSPETKRWRLIFQHMQKKKKTAMCCDTVTAASPGSSDLYWMFYRRKTNKQTNKKTKINRFREVGGQSDTLTVYQDCPHKSSGSQIFALSRRLPENSRALLLLPLMGCSATAPRSMSLRILGVCDIRRHTLHIQNKGGLLGGGGIDVGS